MPDEITTPDETTPTVEPVYQDLTIAQTIGGQTIIYNPNTVAKNVRTADGLDVETRLTTIERAATGAAVIKFADDLAGRDALSESLRPGDIVIVADASADETVDAGGARYVKLPEGQGFRKMSEDESMDVVCAWEHIEGKPDSTPAQIDLAVASKHTHDNSDTLAHLSDDGAGNLLFKGKRINDGKVWVARVTSLADTPTNLADGGLVLLVGNGGGSEEADGE